jgi:hypothetical protein
VSTSFQSNNGVVFADLGLTATASGITVTQTLYNSVTGQTTSMAFVPSPLNYVLGGDMTGSPTVAAGSSYQTFANGIVSLTTQSSRAVEITVRQFGSQTGAYINLVGTDSSSHVAYMRVLRGPSTVIGGYIVGWLSSIGATFFTYRIPPSSYTITDLSPISGAATYIIQGQTDGLSTQLGFNSCALLVRQL